MSDTYLEFLVPKRNTGKEAAYKILIVLAAIVLSVVLFLVAPLLGPFSMIAILAICGALFGAYKLVTMLNVEYEYIFTNGDLDIDKIMNRNSRKRLLSCKCSAFETFGPYKELDHHGKNYQSRFLVCSSPSDQDLWYATFRHSKHGNTLLVFNGTEKLLTAMKSYIPKQLAFEAFVRKPAK